MQVRTKAQEISRLFIEKKFSELDQALALKNIGKEAWSAGLDREKPLSLYAMLTIIKQGPVQSDFQMHEAIIRILTSDLLFTEQFEFKMFYTDWLFGLRKWVHFFGVEKQIEGLVSLLIQLFVEIKRGELLVPLANVAATLFYLNFKIFHFHQSKYTLMMLGSLLPDVLNALYPSLRCCLHFYIGRLSLMDSSHKEAERYFSSALKMNPSKKQRVKLLRQLLPLKAVLGKLPNPKLLLDAHYADFGVVVEAMKKGSVAEIEEVLNSNVTKLVKEGTFFLLSECKQIALRNFLYKMFIILERPTTLPLRTIQLALNVVFPAGVSMDEVISLIGGIIYKGFLKGLINIESKMVLLKPKPFPHL